MTVWNSYLYADTSRTSMYPLRHVAWEVLTLLGGESSAALFDIMSCNKIGPV